MEWRLVGLGGDSFEADRATAWPNSEASGVSYFVHRSATVFQGTATIKSRR